MIISKIDKILIDSSLLDKINVDCISSKCAHRGCCYEEAPVTPEDIKNIDIQIPEILIELPPDISKLITERINNHGYLEFDEKKIRTVGKSSQNWETCIFLLNNKCLLEKYNIFPLSCKIFPLILEDCILKIKKSYNLNCPTQGETPAYILLEKEIKLLAGEEFYQKLVNILIPYGKSGLFYLRDK